MFRGFSQEALPKPWDAICYAIMWSITLEDYFQVIYYFHFPILNYFRNLDHISFMFLLLHLLKDCIYNATRKDEEGKTFHLIHQGLMNKIYIQHLAQNPLLLVNSLASITPQVSLDRSPSPKVKIDLEVKIIFIELELDTRKGTQSAKRTSK